MLLILTNGILGSEMTGESCGNVKKYAKVMSKWPRWLSLVNNIEFLNLACISLFLLSKVLKGMPLGEYYEKNTIEY